MSIRMMALWGILVTTFPLNAFAWQGENITFERLGGDMPGGARIAGFVSATAADYTGGVDVVDRRDDCNEIGMFPQIGLNASATQDDVGDASTNMFGSAKITTPIGDTNPVPNHCISMLVNGMCSLEQNPEAGRIFYTNSHAFGGGDVDASYATRPGRANPPNEINEFATMDIFLYFLGFGVDCTNLFAGEFEPDCGRIIVNSGGFFQRIEVGNTNVFVVHAGNGVFVTQGVLSASNEKSLANFTRPFPPLMEEVCGVNHFWTARQRVPINSGDLPPAVEVSMTSRLGARCQQSFGFGLAMPNSGASPWSWTSVCQAFFFARDYCIDESILFDQDGNPVDSDGNPVDPGDPGNPGDPNGANGSACNPLKVLIEDGKGGLGSAEIDGATLLAYNDMESVTVMVAEGTQNFLCDLRITDIESGIVVVDLEASEASYVAATGIGVFNLSSFGPFEPGQYQVQVGSLYRADVYVVIPGDANLDGEVDGQDLEIVEDNLSNPGVWTTGDVNCDGMVDNLDLAIVQGDPPVLGDVNQDGVVNFFDIGPFISLLSGGQFLEEGDVNQDGAVNFFDVGPFIALLSS